MKNKEIIIQVAYWMFWLIIVGICTFFIIFNAHWLIGDDAIVIRHTGMGKVFAPNDPLTFNKAGGRFFPFSYLAYETVSIVSDNLIVDNSFLPRCLIHVAQMDIHSTFSQCFCLIRNLLANTVVGVKPVKYEEQ